jgi:hypothetical protein
MSKFIVRPVCWAVTPNMYPLTSEETVLVDIMDYEGEECIRIRNIDVIEENSLIFKRGDWESIQAAVALAIKSINDRVFDRLDPKKVKDIMNAMYDDDRDDREIYDNEVPF